MSEEKSHDLHDFMRQLQDRMAAHYRRFKSEHLKILGPLEIKARKIGRIYCADGFLERMKSLQKGGSSVKTGKQVHSLMCWF